MDVKGGCCVSRYGGNAYDLSRMDRIMLRFRPIAPKPSSNSSGSGSSNGEKTGEYVKSGRGKRRYVRNNNRKKNDSSDGSSTASVTKKNPRRNRSVKRLKSSSSSGENESRVVSGGEKDAVVVTLPLLPETPEWEGSRNSSGKGFLSGVEKVDPAPSRFTFGSEESWGAVGGGLRLGGMAGQPSSRGVSTWVHVECITGTWGVRGYGYGISGIRYAPEREMLMDLECDRYPGFVSDGLEKVAWVNRAYREMAAGEAEQEVLVWLVTKGGIELPQNRGFSCSVRVVICGKGKSSRTIPCDVWRLDVGRAFAWRLDVKAALSLGL